MTRDGHPSRQRSPDRERAPRPRPSDREVELDVKLKPAKDGPARAGHPWIYSGAIAELVGQEIPGAFARVVSADGELLGVGTYNPRGSIAVRLMSRRDEPIDGALVRRRIEDAQALREAAGLVAGGGYRLMNGEGDSLPGIVIDVYARTAVLQVLTAGAERLRAAVLDALGAILELDSVFERSSGGARREEGLPDRVEVASGSEPPARIEIREGDARLLVDVRAGQKTGFYLDQRANRALARQLAPGRRVLNCFAYTGAFSVAAARGGAARVVSVETSGPSLGIAREAWALNELSPELADWQVRDAFEVLAEARDRHEHDLIILDPPPFARHRADRERAVRAYRDLNRRALRALAPGGLLLTCSCSPHVTPDAFAHAVATAGTGGARLQVLRSLGPDVDHPTMAAHPEAEYLKGLLVRVAAD